MIRTRIKICGIKEGIHGLAAANAGADAIGFVFHKDSSRYVTPTNAANIASVLPPFVTTVGLFVNATDRKIKDTLRTVRLDMLQFQGDEEPDFCASFGLPYLRAVRMEEGTDLLEWAGRFSSARALLTDTYVPGEKGGTGKTFDWSVIPRDLPIPLILSGGLTSENVGRAVREVKPWAVDVSSGVEASRGVKDPKKIVDFIRSVQREDAG
jgi:phosphoribosylanthranilate isomerase